ncbi:CKLF factor, partial [Promerops cafer]|nr:CKLF factor [Promerops cafer]
VDRAFPRSARGALKIARTLVALATLLCFVASGAHEAYAALAGMETVITVLFLLLYLLRLDARMRCLFWPLA